MISEAKVLIVEDDPASLKAISELLKQSGFMVRGVTNGKHALRAIEKAATDLILLDKKLPDIDGFEICRRLKSDSRFSKIPVIFLTADIDHQTKIQAFKAGAVDYITKPYNEEEVLARVTTHLDLYKTKKNLDKLVALRTAELQKSEELYRTLASNFPNGTVVLFDHDLRYLIAAGTGLAEVGLSSRGMEGKTIWEVFPPETCQMIEPDYRAALAGKSTINEVLFTDQIYYTHTLPVLDSKGEIISGMVMTQNITDQKLAEEERKRLQERLQQSQKMEAIGTMAGGIAHDFNNILSAIIGYTELSFDEVKEGSTLYGNLQEVFQAGNRARSLVKQILTFSRQSGLEFQPVQASLVVKEALKLLRASIPTTVKIVSDIKSESFIHADPGQIHQVLLNLCTNANYAMQGKGVLEVTLEDVMIDNEFVARHPGIQPEPHLKLSVIDSGCGMSAEVMERIFDPFYTTKAKGEGTGMGLSVVHGIVKNYGGIVNVTSEPGKGSVFNTFFPLVKGDVELDSDIDDELHGGKERILFVDDERTIVDLGNQMLTSLGYHVHPVTDSEEALELFKSQADKFDLVITDMTMPKLTGIELAAEIFSIRPDIPIILCTGFSAKIDEDIAKSKGISAFIMKPILRNTLAETVNRLLETKRSGEGKRK